jgi:molybdopterin converting factor small subunit
VATGEIPPWRVKSTKIGDIRFISAMRNFLMAVFVKFSGYLRSILSKDEIKIRDLLSEIERLEGRNLSPIIIKPDGQSREVFKIALNGKVISGRTDLEVKIQDRDQVTIFPLNAGG